MIKKNFEFSDEFRPGFVPSLIGAHFIDEIHSTRHARLLHMHKDQLELFSSAAEKDNIWSTGVRIMYKKEIL